MSSNCEYYQHLMSQMLDQDLMDAETDALRAHIHTCRECRALCAAFSSMTLSLRQDMAEPPESLAQGVMARIAAQAAEPMSEPEPPVPASPPSHQRATAAQSRSGLRRWVYAAACVVLAAGVGILSSSRMQTTSTANDTAAMPETASIVEASAAQDAYAAEEELWEDALDETADREAEEDTDTSLSDAEADQSDAGVLYTLQNPATVPAGRESDFESLLTDAGWPEGEPDTVWHVLMAAEYHGVIYEFLTDDQEQYLLWHDAAEGLYTHSAASVEALWDIFA